MKLPTLDEEEKACVREWLEDPSETSCPFGISHGCEICEAAFPEAGENESFDRWKCPCHIYSKAYVVRIARRMVQ